MMELNKIRNLTSEELSHQEHEAHEQMFRLRFQAKMGQTDTINSLRTLRKDIARIKTVARQRDLGIAVAPTESMVRTKARTTKKSGATKAKKAAEK